MLSPINGVKQGGVLSPINGVKQGGVLSPMNGVKQGGVLSPISFGIYIYIDEVLHILSQSGYMVAK